MSIEIEETSRGIERWPATISVGLILRPERSSTNRDIIMVRQRDSGKWTLISGGVRNELWQEAARREFEEETGLSCDLLRFETCPTDIRLIPRLHKTSVAIYVICYFEGDIPEAGLMVDGQETDMVKVFSDIEVGELVHEGLIDREEFNIPGIDKFFSWVTDF